MLNDNNIQIYQEPFVHWIMEDMLDKSFYEELKVDFPKVEDFNLNDLEFAKGSSVLQQEPGEVAGGTPITQTVMPSLSAITRKQMHEQLMGVLKGGKETKEQRAIIKDVEAKLKDLTPKDKIAIIEKK